MTEDAVLKIATMTKVSLIARMREDLKKGEAIEAVLDRYEYACFAMSEGSLIMVSGRNDR